MIAEGLPTDKTSVWKYTRNQTDTDVRQTLDKFERQLSMLLEDYHTTEDARDSVFHNVVGEDGHGYCRTYGKDMPWSMVYGDKSKSSQLGSQSSTVAEITKQVRIELRQELRDEIREELREEMRAELLTQIQ
ncbi:uncharacterized protein LOC114278110 [Camellia sinensis]|uniref:uncharacterized protein LOC114278110 n=1 Tax=Camellia sinensis TaxID=4442 RepID=UPI0010365D64|nr:uncharacterized protein LOC114278110 [Camellia sinensis]